MAIVKFKKSIPTETVTKEVIRPELNIEKIANIWQAAKTREKLDKVLIQRPNGAKIEMTANSKYKAPTTETQKILYALYQISEEQEHPRGFYFSRNKIAKILNKEWGMNVQKIIDTGLYQLRLTGFILENAFYDSSTRKTIGFTNTFTILSELKMVNEKYDGHITKEACYCEFNQYIYNNLVNGHTKPLLFETLLSLGDDGISQIFYTHLDLILSSEERPLGVYKRRSEGLFEELNFVAKEYKKLKFRKKTLDRVKAKLDGKPLSKGGFLKLEIDKTKDGRDYLFIADDVPQLPLTFHDSKPKTPPEPEPAKQSTEQPKAAPATSTPTELVQYFHHRFFKLEEVEAQKTELEQAKELIKNHGFEIAKYVVNYAYSKAQETNFNIATFGGILQYTGRAKAKYKQDQEAKERQKLAEERDRLIGNCTICRYRNGSIYFLSTIEGHQFIGQMDCLHDEAKHKQMEQEQNTKISINREELEKLI